MAKIYLPSSPCTSTCSKTTLITPPRSISFQLSMKIRYPIPFCFSISSSSLLHWHTKSKAVFAAVEEEKAAVEDMVDDDGDEDEDEDEEKKRRERPCELYVCNLPRSFDVSELLELFKRFGTIISVEISRNPETGASRGSGYVTMGSLRSAKEAMLKLDKSDVNGRELRVRFSAEMGSEKRNSEALNSTPKKILFYESPYKLYVGNLAWSINPEELRNRFSRFGTVVSARVLYDRKGGKRRAYGFLSFQSIAERDAALLLDGEDLNGRVLVVRKGVVNDQS